MVRQKPAQQPRLSNHGSATTAQQLRLRNYTTATKIPASATSLRKLRLGSAHRSLPTCFFILYGQRFWVFSHASKNQRWWNTFETTCWLNLVAGCQQHGELVYEQWQLSGTLRRPYTKALKDSIWLWKVIAPRQGPLQDCKPEKMDWFRVASLETKRWQAFRRCFDLDMTFQFLHPPSWCCNIIEGMAGSQPPEWMNFLKIEPRAEPSLLETFSRALPGFHRLRPPLATSVNGRMLWDRFPECLAVALLSNNRRLEIGGTVRDYLGSRQLEKQRKGFSFRTLKSLYISGIFILHKTEPHPVYRAFYLCEFMYVCMYICVCMYACVYILYICVDIDRMAYI